MGAGAGFASLWLLEWCDSFSSYFCTHSLMGKLGIKFLLFQTEAKL